MSIRALNQLLGRSTIDPSVAAAYEEGRFDEILSDYDFSHEEKRELKSIHAVTFSEFAALALALFSTVGSDSAPSRFHDPRSGLVVDGTVGDEGQAA